MKDASFKVSDYSVTGQKMRVAECSLQSALSSLAATISSNETFQRRIVS